MTAVIKNKIKIMQPKIKIEVLTAIVYNGSFKYFNYEFDFLWSSKNFFKPESVKG